MMILASVLLALVLLLTGLFGYLLRARVKMLTEVQRDGAGYRDPALVQQFRTVRWLELLRDVPPQLPVVLCAAGCLIFGAGMSIGLMNNSTETNSEPEQTIAAAPHSVTEATAAPIPSSDVNNIDRLFSIYQVGSDESIAARVDSVGPVNLSRWWIEEQCEKQLDTPEHNDFVVAVIKARNNPRDAQILAGYIRSTAEIPTGITSGQHNICRSRFRYIIFDGLAEIWPVDYEVFRSVLVTRQNSNSYYEEDADNTLNAWRERHPVEFVQHLDRALSENVL
jgi:hypothetical protein